LKDSGIFPSLVQVLNGELDSVLVSATPTVQRRRLGDHLRALREARGLTGTEAAERLECTQSKISKIEGGRRGIRPKELRELLDIYEVTDQAVRDELLALARSGNERGWWARYSSLISPNYASYIGFEGAAQQITAWEPMVIHGLLQVEDYAREVIRTSARELTTSEIARQVEIRMQRQAQIAKTNPRLWMIMDESTLRRMVGGRDLMRQQLQHLVQLAEDRPRVTIQVLPFEVGASPGTRGALAVLSFDGDPDVAYVETIVGDLYPEGEELAACKLAVDHLKASALSHDESIKLIQRVMREL
jgi:transcriptional regulator with XRE-family HTH domain